MDSDTTDTTQATINWSCFNPEFSAKPEEDVEAHLLRMSDWMDTHAFPDGVKVTIFVLH